MSQATITAFIDKATENVPSIGVVAFEYDHREPIWVLSISTQSIDVRYHVDTPERILNIAEQIARETREEMGRLAEKKRIANLPSNDPMMPARDNLDMVEFEARR